MKLLPETNPANGNYPSATAIKLPPTLTGLNLKRPALHNVSLFSANTWFDENRTD